VTPVQTKILISLAALVAAVVTVASAVQLNVANGSQPMHLASNPGGGGP
jgi:hypothetical protein